MEDIFEARLLGMAEEEGGAEEMETEGEVLSDIVDIAALP